MQGELRRVICCDMCLKDDVIEEGFVRMRFDSDEYTITISRRLKAYCVKHWQEIFGGIDRAKAKPCGNCIKKAKE